MDDVKATVIIVIAAFILIFLLLAGDMYKEFKCSERISVITDYGSVLKHHECETGDNHE